MSRRWLHASVPPAGCRRAGVASLVAVAAALVWSASALAATVTETFTPENGTDQTFAVPAGVNEISVTATGGAGNGGGHRLR